MKSAGSSATKKFSDLPAPPPELVDRITAGLTNALFMNLDIPDALKQACAIRALVAIGRMLEIRGVTAVARRACEAGSVEQVVLIAATMAATRWNGNPQTLDAVVGAVVAAVEMAFAAEQKGEILEESPPPRRPATEQLPTRALSESLERFADVLQNISAMQTQQQIALHQLLGSGNDATVGVASAASEAVAEELARSRRAQSHIAASKGARVDETFNEEERRALERFPVTYTWRKDDPRAPFIVQALRTMLRELDELYVKGTREFLRSLSSRLSAIHRFVNVSQAGELQLATGSVLGEQIDPALVAVLEIAVLANPDLRPDSIDALRLARLCEPTTKEEVANWRSGKSVVPVAHILVPTKAVGRGN